MKKIFKNLFKKKGQNGDYYIQHRLRRGFAKVNIPDIKDVKDRLDIVEADIVDIEGINTQQEQKITNLQNKDTQQDINIANNSNEITSIKQEQITQNTNINNLETKNTEQDTRLQNIEGSITGINGEIANLKQVDTHHNAEIGRVEGITTAINNRINTNLDPRITALETSQATQDNRITALEQKPSGGSTIKEIQVVSSNHTSFRIGNYGGNSLNVLEINFSNNTLKKLSQNNKIISMNYAGNNYFPYFFGLKDTDYGESGGMGYVIVRGFVLIDGIDKTLPPGIKHNFKFTYWE